MATESRIFACIYIHIYTYTLANTYVHTYIRYLLIHTCAHTNRDIRIQAFPLMSKTTQTETYAYRAFCDEDYDDDDYDDAEIVFYMTSRTMRIRKNTMIIVLTTLTCRFLAGESDMAMVTTS